MWGGARIPQSLGWHTRHLSGPWLTGPCSLSHLPLGGVCWGGGWLPNAQRPSPMPFFIANKNSPDFPWKLQTSELCFTRLMLGSVRKHRWYGWRISFLFFSSEVFPLHTGQPVFASRCDSALVMGGSVCIVPRTLCHCHRCFPEIHHDKGRSKDAGNSLK